MFFDHQAKDILFRNQLQCLSFFVSIAGATGMNMSVENNILHLLAKQVKFVDHSYEHARKILSYL